MLDRFHVNLHTALAGLRQRAGRWRRTTPLLLALLAVLLVVPAWGQRVAQAQNPPNPLAVTGESTATLPPDVARISGNVVTTAESAADALNQNSTTLNAVIAAARALGAADADIQTTGLRLTPNTTPGGTSSGYRATNGIQLKTTNLDRIGDLVKAMVDAGITNVNGVDYSLQDPEQLPIQALRDAIGQRAS